MMKIYQKYPIFASLQRKGLVAEWLGRALQKLVQRFESARDLRKNRLCKLGRFFSLNEIACSMMERILYIMVGIFLLVYGVRAFVAGIKKEGVHIL